LTLKLIFKFFNKIVNANQHRYRQLEKIMKNIVFILLLLILSSCGSTSNMRTPNKSANLPNLSNYNHVIVNDFSDGASKSFDDPNIISEGKRFADIIASSIKSKNSFHKVERNVESTDSALLIDGQITKYDDGNPFMRIMLGFGAGSSKFNAKVNIRDNATKEHLGVIDVNKMSWLLGGVIAGSQDTKSHMNSAASKIADEFVAAKKRKPKVI
jgi:hypothetical protein